MSARTSARDVACPVCHSAPGLPCRSLKTGLSNTDTHKARRQAAQEAVSGPRIVELCAGYGGLGMGVSAILGGRMVWVAEFEDDPSRILAHHWPDVPNLHDLTRIDWRAVPGCDVLTAGFPCQPFSHAGKRLGANDARHLWPYIRDGISVLRPQLVVLENVRGLASGQGEPDTDEIIALDERIAHIRRALEVIERRRGKAIREQKPEHVRRHTDSTHRLMVELRAKVARAKRARRRLARALATVLGDLADLGYDAQWYGLRAADVGAPHGRFRFFIFAWPADAPSDPRWVVYGDRAAAADPDDAGREESRRSVAVRPEHVAAEHDGAHAADDLTLLPTPTAARDGNTPETHLARKPGRTVVTSLDVVLNHVLPEPEVLLPTPAVNDMGAAYTPDEWDDWTARQKAKHGNGNGHGKSLEIEAQRLLKTPTAQLAINGGSQHPDKRKGGGHGPTLADEVEHLLPTPTAGDGVGARNSTAYRKNGRGTVNIGDTLTDFAWKHAGHVDPRLLPTPQAHDAQQGKTPDQVAAMRARGHGVANLNETVENAVGGCQDWGGYRLAIERWERVTGRPAPLPTEPGKSGPRLSPAFVEWMMGLPAGHVTDPAIWQGVSYSAARNAQLKALGNGVVWQQAAAATAALVDDMLAENATRAASA